MSIFIASSARVAALVAAVSLTALTTGELWRDHPEKSFAMRADWVDKNPKAARALTMAVIEAQRWSDNPQNRKELCEIVARRWRARSRSHRPRGAPSDCTADNQSG